MMAAPIDASDALAAAAAAARRRPKEGPLLPVGDARDQALGFVIAVLCFMGCLCAVAGLAGARAAGSWRQEIAASATVLVRPSPGETATEAAGRGAEALAAVRGVSEARALDRAASEKLLEPWLGRDPLPSDLPLPQLVTVSLDPRHPASAAALNEALSEAHVDASLDDHTRWTKEVQQAGRDAELAAGAGALLTASAAAAVIVFATRAGLTMRREVAEVLHLVGAEDRFIAGLFQRRFAVLAGASGAVGAAAAAGVCLVAKAAAGSDHLTPASPVAWSDLLVLVACPIFAATVAAIAARRTALSILAADAG